MTSTSVGAISTSRQVVIVLVRVFGQHGEFIGWIYMDAEAVKFLHLAQQTR